MFVNWATNEIIFRIVYCGPSLSGKTTNLKYIYSRLDPSLRGQLVTLQTREERTLFFDFLQLHLGEIAGRRPRFNLYTVPGQAYYAYSRGIILNGVDGIVFVADSQRRRLSENLDALLDLEERLIEQGRSIETIPFVLQYNKRDLPDLLPIAELEDKLNYHKHPAIPAIATRGEGVMQTLRTLLHQVVQSVQEPVCQAYPKAS
ncbi:MAG: ADP-ribosylation factor-like protein [candidate division KSB1 bacterium]|nr:ADP-ribosylation factor-like protein [candidate division KSB1 bacterium]